MLFQESPRAARLACRYADFAGSKINEAFDYTHGNDLWKEKLDYTNAWLSAHISDANALGKPLVVEEFGKAKAAAKVYTGEFPHGIVPGGQPLSLRVITLHESLHRRHAAE